MTTMQSKKPLIRGETIEGVGIKLRQAPIDLDLFIFVADGKKMAKQVGVRRMRWHGQKYKAEGFQRRLDNNRVREIATYLSKNAVLPNALVVAFEKGAVEFHAIPHQEADKPQLGTIVIKGKLQEIDGKLEPLPENERIGYVIDGQHRLRGLEESTLPEGSFPIVISAFHNVKARFQLEQFYALNQTIQIPASHLALLRRELGYQLPPREAYRKAISDIAGYLQEYSGSPFQAEKYVGSSIYKGPLSITVVESMIERAIKLTNLKYYWKQNANEIPATDLEYIAKSLYVFWKSLSDVFPHYWGLRPKDQRLFCAIGLYAMIMFFDKVMQGIDINSPNAVDLVKQKWQPIKDMPWGSIQAVPATVKTYFRPEHLFDAVNTLWQQGGKRPYNFVIKHPVSGDTLVDIELTS
jgi:DGQHR domain-containing protein